ASMKGNPKSSVPKYTIRVLLIWLVPVGSAFFGCYLFVPFLLAAFLTPIEVPKVRARLCGNRAKKTLPCLKVPALLRLSVLWLLQVWWVILFRAGSTSGDESSGEADFDLVEASSGIDPGTLVWKPQTMSVVLPCAGEGVYALNTVRSVYESMPLGLLHEIIVVDDGTNPPLSESYLGSDVREQYNVKIIRHAETVGLIGAKKDGGDAATGDIVVFFDCHVAPQPGWHDSFMRLIGENYRRIVTPVITELDVGTWKQRSANSGIAKCYLTWDADFKWFESEDPYVPVLSGGLLGMSKRWWNETGGYDAQMVGWGGENLDQSLRSWLCGGEIMMAKDSFVAHMWRTGDPRTKPRYTVKAGAAAKNRMRAAVAWFGDFSQKLSSFPSLHADLLEADGSPWYGNLENINEVRDRLQCKPFAWFMHRFKHVYQDGGLIPPETFAIRSRGSSRGSSSSSLCLTFTGQAGTSQDGKGFAVLRECNPDDERQRWHGANRDTEIKGQPCCSGLRAWNTDQCIQDVTAGQLHSFVCDITGHSRGQAWLLDADGQLRQRSKGGFMSNKCIGVDDQGMTQVQTCQSAGSQGPWIKESAREPVESQLYRKALVDMGYPAE
ncbi:unnamed protein product, partial [Polarella glacialis]